MKDSYFSYSMSLEYLILKSIPFGYKYLYKEKKAGCWIRQRHGTKDTVQCVLELCCYGYAGGEFNKIK